MAWEKTKMRVEMAVRLELTGQYTDAEIANAVGLSSAQSLQMLKQRPDYIALRNSVKHNFLNMLDDTLGDDIKAMRQRVSDMVPAALQTIFNAVQQTRDMKLAVGAAETLLKIDGRLAPVNQSLSVPVDKPTTEEDDNVAAALNMALAKRAAEQKVKLEDVKTSGSVN